MQNHMYNTCLSYFTMKENVGAYGVCTTPNMICLENDFWHVLWLDPGIEAFVTSN